MLIIGKSRLTSFPAFQPLTKNLYGTYQDFIFKYPQHCDFTLNNLLVWFGEENLSLSMLNKNVVLKVDGSFLNNKLDSTWYTILGDRRAAKTLDRFFDEGLADELTVAPDYFVESISNRERWEIKEDDDNKDYILNIPSLLNRTGKIYKNFRYQINYFLKNHSEEARIQDIDLLNHEEGAELLSHLRTWHNHSFDKGGTDVKRVDETAIKRLIKLQPYLFTKHRCIGLYINNSLAGFSIFHKPPAQDPIALGNHIKYDVQYKRMFDFLVYATASRLNTEGIEYLNAEQDMGLQGIRHHKEYLNPVGYLRKYSIRPKAV